MPNQAHAKAADHHESAAKSHRAAAEHHGKNDHMKGNEHSAEAQKHSKVASSASDEAHAKSSSKKEQRRGRGSARPLQSPLPFSPLHFLRSAKFLGAKFTLGARPSDRGRTVLTPPNGVPT